MFYKGTITSTTLPEKMAATTPVAIGTRGTVGSLVKKEIDYFNKIGHLDICGSSSKSHRPGFWSLKISWKKKKRSSTNSSSNRFIPSICSAVDHVVDNTNRITRIPGFSYRSLKDELKDMTG
ncbi:hypothetical protein M5689_002491 [Euphorbia peplus]|nr:hypothetical protein M5689_002491 [Euphorbia peplus]